MNTYRFSNLEVGLVEKFEVTVNSSMLESFVSFCGDDNPLHVDSEYARGKGYKSNVVHGLLTSSFYSTLAGVYLPGKYCLLHGINISFIKPVFVGDNLTIAGEVVHLNEAYRQIEIKATILNQEGQKVSKALIKAGIMYEDL